MSICPECGEVVEDARYELCNGCAQEMADAALAKIEPPEGGWPRGSDMDRL